jgi:hypothetical protein
MLDDTASSSAPGSVRKAGQRPVDVPVQAVLVEDRGRALQAFDGGFGGEAEVEHRRQIARDHVGRAGAGVEVGNLEAGRREEVVAVVPVLGGQFGQGRGGQVDRVLRQMRVGHVALHTAHGQLGAEGAATAVLDHVTDQGGARRFADDAPVQAFLARARRSTTALVPWCAGPSSSLVIRNATLPLWFG